MTHRVLYLQSVGTSGVDGVTAAGRKVWLRRQVESAPESSFEVVLAHRQPRVFGPLLTELGFMARMKTTNPNSGRHIEAWFKDAQSK